MFCMNCGQQLPDGAKFCLNCGTSQGAVLPTETIQAETINLDGMHTFVPALCPNCSAHMKVDSSVKVAHCDSCGTECLVQDAIKALTVRGNVQVGNAIINVSGTSTDSLLQRVEIMLADGDFNGAMSKCDTILDSEPTNGKVFLYMLMSSLGCKNRTELANQSIPFDGNQYYIKAVQYGDASLKTELTDYINTIRKRDEEFSAKLNNLKVGDTFFYGSYNGQPISWKVLRIQDCKILVITTHIVCEMPYHQTWVGITWSECTLRKWLNNDFINGNFTQAERARILPSKLNNDNNFTTPGGAPTTDNVFLLSIKEAKTLFANDKARANGSCWWLRSPGLNSPSYAADVYNDGKVHSYGSYVHINRGVRPTLWLSLNS